MRYFFTYKLSVQLTIKIHVEWNKLMPIEEIIETALELKHGDILIHENPYEDPIESDFFPFHKNKFEPGHSMLWIKGSSHPLGHSVREGYRLPGVRLTKLPLGKCMVFRYTGDPSLPHAAADIMRNWALSARFYSRAEYLKTYPNRFWADRQAQDLRNFYTNEAANISGPATPYLEPRASIDMADLARQPKLIEMGEEALRRAIKFASRATISSPYAVSKGQRCTPVLVCAYQAAVLAPIVKQGNKLTLPFKKYKGKCFEEYADEVLIDGWRESDIGKKLLQSRGDGEYASLFTIPFTVDERYTTPKLLYTKLIKSSDYALVGQFSYFNNRLELIDRLGKVIELDTQQLASLTLS